MPLAGFMAFTWDGIYIGMTLTRRMLAAMFVSMVVFSLVLAVCRQALGNHALWLAFTLYLLSRGLLQTLLWRRNKMFSR